MEKDNCRIISRLAFNIFNRGRYHSSVAEYLEKKDIACPEDLYTEMMGQFLKGESSLKETRFSKKDIPVYNFENDKMTTVEIAKGISYWSNVASAGDGVITGKLFKVLWEFLKDTAVKNLFDSEEFKKVKL